MAAGAARKSGRKDGDAALPMKKEKTEVRMQPCGSKPAGWERVWLINMEDNKKGMQAEAKEVNNQKYQEQVKAATPTANLFVRMVKAFIVGGIICCIGQVILNYATNSAGLDKETAGSWCSMLLVLLSVILTGFNIYPKLVEWGGAGALVPITGFANSVSAPAIEYKKEGQVFGIGCKIFTIAGPVILYGIFTSWVLGVFYWLLSYMK